MCSLANFGDFFLLLLRIVSFATDTKIVFRNFGMSKCVCCCFATLSHSTLLLCCYNSHGNIFNFTPFRPCYVRLAHFKQFPFRRATTTIKQSQFAHARVKIFSQTEMLLLSFCLSDENGAVCVCLSQLKIKTGKAEHTLLRRSQLIHALLVAL